MYIGRFEVRFLGSVAPAAAAGAGGGGRHTVGSIYALFSTGQVLVCSNEWYEHNGIMDQCIFS